MEKKYKTRKKIYRAIIIFLAAIVLLLAVPGKERSEENISASAGTDFMKELLLAAEESMMTFWSPLLTFSQNIQTPDIQGMLTAQFPLFSFLKKQKAIVLISESGSTYDEIIRAEGQDEYSDQTDAEKMRTPKTSAGRFKVDEKTQQLLQNENQAAAESKEAHPGAAQGLDITQAAVEEMQNLQKLENYQWDYYEKYESLVNEFYIVDAATAADEKQLNLTDLLTADLSVEKRTDDLPQILIYHTHSQEGFANSVPGDRTTTIEGVGEYLTRILEDQYGYNVLHHLGQYDVEQRDYAYNNSLPAIEVLLAENPTIEVVIDLHRDEVAEGTKLVTEIDGRPTAMFMFFNGLSRTRKHGDIDYLPNENLADNLAFSFQMQVLCNEYYPGLTRRIYLKGYRYNMHLKPRCLLVEMGAQTNTYEECYNACIPLAKILDMELSGVDFGY